MGTFHLMLKMLNAVRNISKYLYEKLENMSVMAEKLLNEDNMLENA